MKGSSRQTSHKNRLRVIIVLGVASVALLFFVPRFAGMISGLFFEPVMRFESWLFQSDSTVASYFVDRSDLVRKIEELERNLAYVNGSQGAIERLQNENMQLRSLLGEEEKNARIAASVIGRPTATPYDVLVIDKGSADGISKNAPVYIGSDQIVGFIAQAYQHSAIVALATTPNFESTVYIFGPNIYTTAKGIGGGVLQVNVPQGIVLSLDDLVVVPALGGGVYGRISSIDSVPSQPEQRGYVTLDVPMQSIRFVSVGESSLSSISFEEALEVVQNVRDDLIKVPVPSGVLVDVGSSTEQTATSTDTNNEETYVQ